MLRVLPLPFIVVLLGFASSVHAGSRIVATGGVSPIEGGGGGGLSPWALVTGYGSAGEWGGSAFATRVQVKDFMLSSAGAAVGWSDRVELSAARQWLEVDPLDLTLRQDVFGAKIRVAGEFLYSRLPQVAVGVQHKRHRDFAVPELLGARDDSGTDLYISAARLFFASLFDRNLFVNVVARSTGANETGLLGHGGPRGSRSTVLEGTLALFMTDRWVIGYEYRDKPRHLASVGEHAWQDVFIAWFPHKAFSVVAARVDLDTVAELPGQDGWYLSLQASF